MLLIALAAGAAVVVSARLCMTPGNVMSSMQDALELQLGARMTCGALDVRPLSGCVLRDVQLFETRTDSAEPFLRCKEVRLTHSLLPLLLKKLLIRDIAVVDPVMTFTVRQRRFSSRTDGTPPLQVSLMPRSLHVSGGRVLFDAPYGPMGLEDIECDAQGISFLHSAPVTLAARIIGDPRAEVSGSGRYALARRSLTLEIVCRGASLAYFKEHLSSAGIPLVSGLVSIQTAIEAKGDTIGLQLACGLRDGGLATSASADAQEEFLAMEGLHAEAQFNASWDMRTGTCEITGISGKLLSAPFRGRVALRSTPAGTRIRGMLDVPEMRADEFFAHCTRLPAFIPTGLRLEGTLGVRMEIDGMPGAFDLFPSLLLQFHDTRVCYPALARLQPSLNGTVTLDADRMSSDALKIGTDDLWISLAGDVSGYRTQAPRADLRVVSSCMNLPGLFTPDEDAGTEPIGPLDFGALQLQGPVDLGTVYFLGMKLGGVQGSYRFERNVFEIRDLRGTVEDGRFTAGLSVDLGVQGLAYSARVDVDAVPLSEALQLVPGDAKQHISGALYASLKFAGTGSDHADCMRNLTARGDLRLGNAAVNLAGMLPQLADAVKNPMLERVSFDSAGLQLDLRKGTVRVSGAFTGPDICLYPEGSIGLDGSLDLDVPLYISPVLLTGSEDLPACLPREKGLALVPIDVLGTFTEPRFEISRETLGCIIGEALSSIARESLSAAVEAQPGG